jgi:polysaccharide export outer membrane protein
MTPEIQWANLPAQPIGANDLIAVSVYDAPELTRTVRVSADGFIRLPILKQRVI